MLEKLKDGIYRVCIPFENIYTTSFILIENGIAIVLDSGSNDEDAQKYIIPAIKELNTDVQYLVSSHTHGDHYGGINALRKAFPDATHALFSKEAPNSHYLYDGEILLERFMMLNLKGHSEDSLGVLDMKNNVLLSFDSLQLKGVGRYPTYFYDYDVYISTLNRVRDFDVDTIIASHDYEPCGYIAEGKETVKIYLDECKLAADERDGR